MMRPIWYVLSMITGLVSITVFIAMLATGVLYEPYMYIKVPEIILHVAMGIVLGHRTWQEAKLIRLSKREEILTYSVLVVLMVLVVSVILLHWKSLGVF